MGLCVCHCLSETGIVSERLNTICTFSGHSHCTKLGGEVSSFLEVTASIIQGSGLGPAAYTVNAADLHPRHTENASVKYADDTYLIIPGAYYHTRDDEVSNVKSWAAKNNLQLNCSKSREIRDVS